MLGMKNHFVISGNIEIREVDIAGVACTILKNSVYLPPDTTRSFVLVIFYNKLICCQYSFLFMLVIKILRGFSTYNFITQFPSLCWWTTLTRNGRRKRLISHISFVDKNVHHIPILYTLLNSNPVRSFNIALSYIQASTVQRYNSVACQVYLPVLYTHITTEVECTVARQKLKMISCKMHAFQQNAISCKVLYSGFI